jgi:hypothetical protein
LEGREEKGLVKLSVAVSEEDDRGDGDDSGGEGVRGAERALRLTLLLLGGLPDTTGTATALDAKGRAEE